MHFKHSFRTLWCMHTIIYTYLFRLCLCLTHRVYSCVLYIWRASQVAQNLPASAGDVRDVGSIPGSGRSPGVGNDSTPVFLPGEFHGQRSLAGHSLWGRKESDATERLDTHYI